jgi:tetratricopeptide (TPR) repeat protein
MNTLKVKITANILLITAYLATGLHGTACAEGGGGSNRSPSNPNLLQGIDLYKAGNYRESISKFGMALNTEYDNAILHYYMANAFINLKQRETAIREFRIAYALAPRDNAGILSKQALSYLGADNYMDGVVRIPEKKAKETTKEPQVDPIFEKTLQMLKKQSEDAGLESKMMTPAEAEVNRILDDNIKKSKAAAIDAILQANPDEVHVPAAAIDHLVRIKRLNDEKMRRAGYAVKKSGGIKDSADSLQTLLGEKNSRTAPRLVPHGTNLYIRNYKSTKNQ